MKTSQIVVCLLCIGAMPISGAFAQGKSGKSGPHSTFPSVPMGPKFIVLGAGAGTIPAVMAPSTPGMSGLSMGGAAVPSAAGGVAGGNMPSVSAVVRGLPPQAQGIGQPGGKHRVEAPVAAAGEPGTQSVSSQSNSTPGEIQAETAQQANELIARIEPRALPTCR